MEPATSWFLVGFVNHCATTGTPEMCDLKKKTEEATGTAFGVVLKAGLL